MDTDFDRDAPIALYYQLKEKILQKILSNQWKPGQQIPSETELCHIYNVSRITVRKALDELVRSGHLIRQQGKGTFVTNASLEYKLSKFYSFSEELKLRGLKEYSTMLSFSVISADEKLVEKLALDAKSQVFKIERLRMVDETPYTIEISYIPFMLCPKMTEKMIVKDGLYKTMRNLGVVPERAIEKFRATSINKHESALMHIKHGTPAIHLERTTFSGLYTIEYCSSVVRGDFFTYTVELKS